MSTRFCSGSIKQFLLANSAPGGFLFLSKLLHAVTTLTMPGPFDSKDVVGFAGEESTILYPIRSPLSEVGGGAIHVTRMLVALVAMALTFEGAIVGASRE